MYACEFGLVQIEYDGLFCIVDTGISGLEKNWHKWYQLVKVVFAYCKSNQTCKNPNRKRLRHGYNVADEGHRAAWHVQYYESLH